jgi:hypothetical protein
MYLPFGEIIWLGKRSATIKLECPATEELSVTRALENIEVSEFQFEPPL